MAMQSRLTKQALHVVNPLPLARAALALQLHETLRGAKAEAACLLYGALPSPRRKLAVHAVNHACRTGYNYKPRGLVLKLDLINHSMSRNLLLLFFDSAPPRCLLFSFSITCRHTRITCCQQLCI